MIQVIGLDVGTSAVKAVLLGADQTILAAASVALTIERPKPGWSEQHPEDWWNAAKEVIARLAAAAPLRKVRAIGLSGQMHGAVLLDAAKKVIRPVILWNDRRAVAQSEELNAAIPDLGIIAGVPAMTGFTAPKLMWMARHEPANHARIAHILPPKDYIRFKLTGKFATDMYEASGTLWLDIEKRQWSDTLIAASGISRAMLPELYEGNAITGALNPALAAEWGIEPLVPIAAGAGDVAAAAIGMGVIGEGDGLISIGTSAQYFVASCAHRPAPRALIHAFAHGLPGCWSQMAALLNGASCLGWAASLFKSVTLGDLMAQTEAAYRGAGDVLFLPYLTGERSPLNDPHAKGVLYGLTPGTDAAALMQAVMEGVGFAIADGQESLSQAGIAARTLAVTGGGAKSLLWMRILASVLDRPLPVHTGTDYGPALGAARLARLSVTGERPQDVCQPPAGGRVIDPEPELVSSYRPRLDRFRALYQTLKPNFRMDS
ncbi:xylulokinase [soil metagenome]